MYGVNSSGDRPIPLPQKVFPEPRRTVDSPRSLSPRRKARPPALRHKAPVPTVKKRSLRYRRTRTGLLLLGAIALMVWYWWNSRLLLSAVGGIGTMAFVYRMPQLDWQLYGSKIRQISERVNPRLLKAIGSGSIATLFLYGIASVLAAAETPWMGVSAVVQDLGAIAIAGLLIWQFLERRRQKLATPRQIWLRDLTAESPLKRSIAVRELTAGGDRNSSSFQEPSRSHLKDYLRLMLDRESEPSVRKAIVEGLQTLETEESVADETLVRRD